MRVALRLSVEHNLIAALSTVQLATQVQELCSWNVESGVTGGIVLVVAVAWVVMVLATRSGFDIESDVKVCSWLELVADGVVCECLTVDACLLLIY